MIDCNCASFYFLRERMEKVFERKTKEDRPVLAICYDFDKTLSPDDMQAQGYIQSVGYEVESFWTESNGLAESNDMDQNLAYMYTMIQKARGRFIFNRKTLMDYGAKVSLFPGVDTWFKRIREYGETKGVIVEHYIISSGLKEMIEGTKVANEFEKIYASSFYYDENGEAKWPAQVINYTSKTQFLFRIVKGTLDVNDSGVNDYFNPEDIRIPSRKTPILVYKYRTPERSEFQGVDTFTKDSVDYVVFSRYTEGIQIWNVTDMHHPKEVAFVPTNVDGCMTFDVTVDYPFVYSTLAPGNGSFNTAKDQRGIIVYNVEDIYNIKTMKVTIPKDQYYNVKVGDKEPTFIEKKGNYVYVNFAEKGLAEFDVTNPSSPKFIKTIEINNDSGHVQPFHILPNRVVLSGNYWWKDIYVYDMKK